jgi:hypothetical protein
VFINNQSHGDNLRGYNQSVASEQQDGLEWEEETKKLLNLNAISMKDLIIERLYCPRASTIEYLQWKILDR